MLNVEKKQATCDWPRCECDVELDAKTYVDQIKELNRHGWRASKNLGKYVICYYHNSSRKWEDD